MSTATNPLPSSTDLFPLYSSPSAPAPKNSLLSPSLGLGTDKNSQSNAYLAQVPQCLSQSNAELYHNRAPGSNFGCVKVQGFNDKKGVNINSNMDPLFIVEPRELSRGLNSNLVPDCGIPASCTQIGSALPTRVDPKTRRRFLPPVPAFHSSHSTSSSSSSLLNTSLLSGKKRKTPSPSAQSSRLPPPPLPSAQQQDGSLEVSSWDNLDALEKLLTLSNASSASSMTTSAASEYNTPSSASFSGPNPEIPSNLSQQLADIRQIDSEIESMTRQRDQVTALFNGKLALLQSVKDLIVLQATFSENGSNKKYQK